MKGPIPVFRPSLPKAKDVLPYLEKIDRSGWYSNFGPLEREFKRRLIELMGNSQLKGALLCNGTMALQVTLMAFGVPKESLCLMPAWTFAATPSAAISAGLKPYFVDVNLESWQLTPEIVMRELKKTTEKVGSVIVVVPFGSPFDVGPWDKFTEETGVPVVVDAAASFKGTAFGKTPVMLSLHATKMLGIGEGGAVFSTSSNLIRQIESISNFGFGEERISEIPGLNGKLHEYAAAVGLAMIKQFPIKAKKLWDIGRVFHEKLKNIAHVKLQSGFGDTWIGPQMNILFEDPIAHKAQLHFERNEIETRQWWAQGCHLHKAYEQFPRGSLTHTNYLSERVLGLPFHTYLTPDNINKICSHLEVFLRYQKLMKIA